VFIELVDHLRCPESHRESALVLAAERTVERYVLQGTLGCPVCRAEFVVRDGVVRFANRAVASVEARADDEEAMRIAAFLDLTAPRGFALLEGRWATHAPAVATSTPMELVLLNAAARVDAQPGISPIVADGCPFAAGALTAAAIDGEFADHIVAAVRPGGRIIGTVDVPLPGGAQEITRDDRLWIAEKSAVSRPVPITRR
jgi:uncharacterized protein YbaR (Trm112 family)